MKKINLIITIICLTTSLYMVQGQSLVNAGFDVGGAVKGDKWVPSILYHEAISFNNMQWLQVNLGLRAWGFYSGNTNLYINSDGTGGGYLQYRNTSINGISFVVGANVKFWRLNLGANMDLAGLSYGSKRNAFCPQPSGNPGVGVVNYDKWLATRPVILNALPLILNNYNGVSEVYARIWLIRNFGLKLGYTYGQIAYRTSKVKDENVYLDKGKTQVSDNYGMLSAALTFSISN